MVRGGLIRLSPRKKKVQPASNDSTSTSIRMETVRVPSHIEEGSQNVTWFRLGPIMTTILVLGLIWIGVVVWLVSGMPER